MKTTIDNLTSATGWTGSGGGSVHGVNQHKEMIAGNLSASLIFRFTGAGSYVQKTFSTPIDASGMNQIVLSVWSQLNRKGRYETGDDFEYSIEVGTGNVFLLPVWQTFDAAVLQHPGGSIDKVKITKINAGGDYLIVSNLIACIDELPIDIYDGAKEQIEHEAEAFSGSNGILLGTVSVSVGDSTLAVNYPWLRRYSVIRLVKGADSETHQLDDYDGTKFRFFDAYDGKNILRTMAGASLYVKMPVEYGQHEKEVLLPSIVIWNLAPEIIPRTGKTDLLNDTFKVDGSVMARKEGETLNFFLNIDVTARQAEIDALMSYIVRRFITKQVVWVNGRKLKVDYMGIPSEELRSQSFSDIIHTTYQAAVEIREDVWERAQMHKAIQATLDVSIKET